MEKLIQELVHEYYWQQDLNCAKTTLLCLSRCFSIPLEKQTLAAAAGLHGAGGFRAQCGLVEGALMFLSIYFHEKGKSDREIAALCYTYAQNFTNRFGSLTCRELRPQGFSAQDPPHACETLTCSAIIFAYEYIRQAA